MAEYQKYMFDDFVVGEEATAAEVVDAASDIAPETPAEDMAADELAAPAEVTILVAEEPAEVEYPAQDIDYAPAAPVETEITYTQDDYDDAVKKAADEGYAKGQSDAENSALQQQNRLLEDIKNTLSQMFAAQAEQTEGIELSALRFFAACLRKVMPTITSTSALPEIKNFLEANFADLSNQKFLAFYLAPDMVKEVAPLIEKAADKNDFEGKISIHKDGDLALSDCRIEWKDGRVERTVAK